MTIGCARRITRENGATDQMDGDRSVRDVLAIADAIVAPLMNAECIDLRNASGRISAGQIRAPRPMPFFSQSAMDGFAVRTADLAGQGPWRLPVAGTIAAGDRPDPIPGTEPAAMRIYTGAPVPGAFDAVVMMEHCRDDGDVVVVGIRPVPGENIRAKGSDIARDAVLVAAGIRIEPRHIGLLAANGYTSVNVFKRPRVGVFSTGSELLPNGATGAARIHDANRPMLIALANRAGADVVDLGIVDDDLAETARFFRGIAGRFDLLISSGAASIGARDFVGQAFVEAGGTVHAWKVALKPGKPILLGTLDDRAYLGLPGNPLSAFVGFQLFGRRQISRLCGVDEPHGACGRAVAGFSLAREGGRLEIIPARVVSWSKEGVPTIDIAENRSSGTLHALCQADGLAMIPAEQGAVRPGDVVEFVRFCSPL